MDEQTQFTPHQVVCAGLPADLLALAQAALPGSLAVDCSINDPIVVELCREVGPAILLLAEASLRALDSQPIRALSILTSAQVLVLCEGDGTQAQEPALLSGCSGVLPAHSPAALYRRAIDAISQGELWFPRSVLSRIARGTLLGISHQHLTVREREILDLLAANQKNQDIADLLFISRDTVRWHLRTLYSKIGVSDRTAAQQYARNLHAGTLRIQH